MNRNCILVFVCLATISTQIYALPPIGLQNYNNTCFINSALQILYNIDPLRVFFENVNIADMNLGAHNQLYKQAQTLFKLINDRQKEGATAAINELILKEFTTNAYNLIDKVEGTQADAGVFLSSFLSDLIENISKSNQWKDKLTGNLMFQSQTIKVLTTGSAKTSLTPYVFWSIPTSSNTTSIQDYFDQKTEKRIIEKGSIKALVRRLVSVPSFLFLRIERVQQTTFITTPINANSVIDIGNFLQLPYQFTNTQFTLCGAIVHQGGDPSCGHYIAYVKSADVWYKCDDTKVSLINNFNTIAAEINSNAVILMYRATIYPPQFPAIDPIALVQDRLATLTDELSRLSQKLQGE